MTIEKQLVNRELSQRIKELGVKQESLFWWVKEYGYSIMDGANTIDTEEWGVVYADNLNDTISKQKGEHISALTVAELGEMLPNFIGDGTQLFFWNTGNKSYCQYWDKEKKYIPNGNAVEADTEADARAKMLIYLIENNLITL